MCEYFAFIFAYALLHVLFPQGHEKTLDSLEMKLQMLVCCHMGSGNQTRVPSKNMTDFHLLSHLSMPKRNYLKQRKFPAKKRKQTWEQKAWQHNPPSQVQIGRKKTNIFWEAYDLAWRKNIQEAFTTSVIFSEDHPQEATKLHPNLGNW